VDTASNPKSIRIPVSDDSVQNRRLLPQIEAALREILLAQVSPGRGHGTLLEQDVSNMLGGCHAVAVQSGTAAMLLAVRALGIGHGDEVITVPNSDLMTTATIGRAGARFVLCDVDPETMNIDPNLLEQHITPRTRAVFPVHMYGHPANMTPIMDIAARHGLAVIEDACLSLGAIYHGRYTGLIGSAGCFSFGIGKVIGGGGDGGMLVTPDPAVAHEARLLRGVGQDLREGYFVYMSDLQAAIVRIKLRHLAAWQAERQAVADRYARHFQGTPVKAPVIGPGCTHAWREYVVLVPGRDHVRQALAERGIGTAVRYIPPVHLQPVYRHLGLGPGSLPVAEALAERLLALPMYPGLLAEHVDEVAETVLEAVAQTAA